MTRFTRTFRSANAVVLALLLGSLAAFSPPRTPEVATNTGGDR